MPALCLDCAIATDARFSAGHVARSTVRCGCRWRHGLNALPGGRIFGPAAVPSGCQFTNEVPNRRVCSTRSSYPMIGNTCSALGHRLRGQWMSH